MERGVSRGKREVCPSDQATRKGLGNLLDSLACLGESRGDSPPASLADNDLPGLYGSPGASWQDKQAEGEAVPDVSIWYILYARCFR